MTVGGSFNYWWRCLSFFGSLRCDMSLWGCRSRYFQIILFHLIVRRLNVEVATKCFFINRWNNRVVLEPCFGWKCIPTAISGGVNIPSSMPFVTSDKLKGGLTKVTSKDKCLIHPRSSVILLPYFLNEIAIVSKVPEASNFELHTSLSLGFTNIRGLPSNFVSCESFIEWNSFDVLI